MSNGLKRTKGLGDLGFDSEIGPALAKGGRKGDTTPAVETCSGFGDGCQRSASTANVQITILISMSYGACEEMVRSDRAKQGPKGPILTKFSTGMYRKI